MTQPLIAFRDVSVSRGGRPVLKRLSFEIAPGEHLFLLGENGVGKTTLLKTVLGFLPPESGTITIEGSRRAGRFAYLPQESLSGDLPISVREVVDIGMIARKMSAHERRKKTENLLEALDCSPLAERSYATLSGGEKQRVSLARCIAQAPELLILDEPTAGLDPEIRGRFYPMLLELAESHGAAVLVVTHDLVGIPEAGWKKFRLEQTGQGSSLRELR